jgi:4-amino-4-deoxy-L-arabinose transferase-like glycosyltransferase
MGREHPWRAAWGWFGVSLALNLVWALAIPPLDAPDEPSHLRTIRMVARTGKLPEVHYRFDRNPRGEVVDVQPDPELVGFAYRWGRREAFEQLPYEAMQPPTYYVLAGLASRLTAGDPGVVLVVGRVVSAVLGSLGVLAAWWALRGVDPRATGAVAVMALLPQYAFNSASASNDAAVNAAAALALAVQVWGFARPGFDRFLIGAGAAAGLAFVCKLNAVALLPGLALGALLRPGAGGWRPIAMRCLGAAAGFALVAGPLMARNLVVHGEPTGAAEALRFYRGRFEPLTTDPAVAWAFLKATARSFAGRFGWVTVEQPGWIHAGNAALVVISVGLSAVRWWRDRPVSAAPQVLAVLGVVLATLVGLFAHFNLTVALQPQARYLFPALVPIAWLLGSGWATLPLAGKRRLVVLGFLIGWLVLQNVVGLLRVTGVAG